MKKTNFIYFQVLVTLLFYSITMIANETEYPRFAVISDLHVGRGGGIGYEAKLTKTLQILVKQQPKLDAIFCVGDIVDSGTAAQFTALKTILDRELNGTGIRPVLMLGNHEYIADSATMRKNYATTFPGQYHQYIDIKGYPFITISHENYYGYGLPGATTGPDPKIFLQEKLVDAAANYPNKPIFVFCHMPITGTVYGSFAVQSGDTGWGMDHLTNILNPYKQVITFSGHSHYSVGDERSIFQKNFTSINDGGLAYGETEKGFEQGTRAGKSENVIQGTIVTVKENGDVRIDRYDFFNDVKIKENQVWLIEAPHDGTKFKYTSTRTGEEAPYFENGAKLRISDITDGGCTLTIPQAKDDYDVQQYLVEVLLNGTSVVKTLKYFSCFYENVNIPKTIIAYLKDLDKTKTYTIRVKAVDSFGKQSTPLVTESFVPKYSEPDPNSLVSVYPVADSWVKNGTSSSTNNGSSDLLEVKLDNPSADNETGYIRETFFKFDLNGLNPDSISSAKLILTLKKTDTNVTATEWEVKYISDENDNWDEKTITWKNKPISTESLALRPGQASGIVRFELTDAIIEELTTKNKILSLHLVSTNRGDGKTFAQFHSKEATAVSDRPVILIEKIGKTTGLSSAFSDKIKVYSENGYVRSSGTEKPMQVYNISGMPVNANMKLETGIYIVKIDYEIIKVIVK